MTIKHLQLNYTIDWQEERRSLNKLGIKGNKFKLKSDKFLHTKLSTLGKMGFRVLIMNMPMMAQYDHLVRSTTWVCSYGKILQGFRVKGGQSMV